MTEQMKRKLIVFLAALMASKHSIASSIAAGVFGAAIAPVLGFDPWTWIMGAIGGVIVRVKLPPTNRMDSIVNSIISVMLAGLAAPYIHDLITFEKFPVPSVYFVAFLLAACWPWAINLAWTVGKNKITKWSDS